MINLLRKRWYIVIPLFFILGLVFFKQIMAKTKKRKESLYHVKKQTLKETLSLSGEVDAEEKVTLRFQTSGRLAWVGVKEGDYVKKYQAIASLDKRELEKTLKKYLNLYLKTRWNFDQTKDDYKGYELWYIPEETRTAIKRIVDKAQFDLDNSVIDVELKHLALEYANLWTPIEGIVSRVDVPYAGVNITPAQAEFEIINPNTLYFSATADQTEVVNFFVGKKGKIVFDAYPNEEVKGEVYWIGFTPKKGETGTVYQLKIKFNFDKSLKIGMTGDANFIIKELKDVIALPLNYLKKDRKGDYVYVLIAGKKEKRYLKKGKEIEGKVVIKEGLREGEVVGN